MSSVTLMALLPPAFASSASDPLLLAIDLDEVEADPLAASLALAAAFGDARAFARPPRALGGKTWRRQRWRSSLLPFHWMLEQDNFGRWQIKSRADSQATMPWPSSGDGLDIQIRMWGWCDGLPIPLVAPGNGLTKMSMG